MDRITERQRRALREEVGEEFPDDEMMRELHFVRRLHRLRMEGASQAEQVAFYEGGAAPVAASRGSGQE